MREGLALFAVLCFALAAAFVFVQARRSALSAVLSEEPPLQERAACAPVHPASGFRLVPATPDAAMLVPFRDCPIDELEEAYGAMLAIVAARQAGDPRFDQPVRYRLLEDPADSYLPTCRPMRDGGEL